MDRLLEPGSGLEAAIGMKLPGHKSFLSAVFWNWALMAVSLPVSMATAVVVARWLGPAGKGELALATTVGTLLFLALSLGVPVSLSYYLSGGRLPEGALVKTAITLAGALSAAAILTAALLDRSGWCQFVFGSPRLSRTAWIIVGALPFQFLGTFLQFVILAQGRRVLFAALPVVGTLVAALLTGLLAWSNLLTPPSAAAAQAVSHLATASILLVCVGRRVAWWRSPAAGVWKALVRYSSATYVAQNLQFLIQRVDVFLVSAMLDYRAVGLYAVAFGIAELLLLLPQRFGALYLSRVAGDRSPEGKAQEVAVSCSLVVVGTVVAAAALSAGAPFAIRFFYGDGFAGSVTPFLLLLPGVCGLAASSVQGAYLSGIGKVNTYAATAAAGLALNVALNLTLIPRYGLSGAAVASSLAYCAQAFLLIRAVARLTRARPLAMLTSAPPAVVFGLLKRAFR